MNVEDNELYQNLFSDTPKSRAYKMANFGTVLEILEPRDILPAGNKVDIIQLRAEVEYLRGLVYGDV